ncbi:MAG: tetratricopeptide repeat protein [Lysobacterales bacterium]
MPAFALLALLTLPHGSLQAQTALPAGNDNPAALIESAPTTPRQSRDSLRNDIVDSQRRLAAEITISGAASVEVARERARLGALHYLNREPLKAVIQLKMAVPPLEQTLGIFNHQLVEPLGYLGLSQQLLEQHEAAADTLTRAQHITHRASGTLNESQIPLVYSKADSLQAQGEWWQAEQLQYTVYRLHKHNFGVDAPETLGAMNQLGTWLTRAGRTKTALSLYRSGLKDLKDAEGNDTPAMAPLMEGMARAFLFSRGIRGRSLNLLLRVQKLTAQHPDHFGPADQLMANLQLADTLMLFSLERDAMPYYLAAWNTIQETAGLSDWEHNQFSQRQLVSGPFEELTEQQASTRKHFQFSFDLRKDGRPSNVKLVSTSASPTLALPTLATFRAVRFRPQFSDGEAIVRPNQKIWLSYRRQPQS